MRPAIVENRFVEACQRSLRLSATMLSVRRDYPSCGPVRTLLRRFTPQEYLGIKLEISQGYCPLPEGFGVTQSYPV